MNPSVRRAAWIGVVTVAVAASASASPKRANVPRLPIADPVEQDLLPSGISHLPVILNASRALTFRDETGVDVLHLLGEVVITVGDNGGQELLCGESVIWLVPKEVAGESFIQLQILLWRDAQIIDVAHTTTSGPVLFATLNTTGRIQIETDDVGFEPFRESRAYQRGQAIRRALAQLGEAPPWGSDEQAMLRVIDPSAGPSRAAVAKPKPLLHIRSDGELKTVATASGQMVLTVTGGVYLSRATPGQSEFVEISADSVVVFFPPSGKPAEDRGPRGGPSGLAPRRDVSSTRPKEPPATTQLMAAGLGDLDARAAYLEGDVVLSQGGTQIRASRLYYDFAEDRALILDAVIHTTMFKRNIPLYLRAAEIRQLSPRHFTASNAVLTTSEFHTPHYHVGASRIELTDLTQSDPSQRIAGIRAGRFRIDHATLNIGGRPILYWPHISGDVDTGETAIQSLRTGFSDEFGVELETEWNLFSLMNLETPAGFDSTLSLDYFSERGPAVGVDAEYERDKYFGLLRSYVLKDDGKDFLGRKRRRPSRRDIRGRILLRHRQILENDWQLTLETSYISDESFLEEFFESEFDNDKEQETLLYLKKQHDNRAITFLLQPRILDFVTQTERLPDMAHYILGESLGGATTWFSESRAGVVRFRPKDQRLLDLLRRGRVQGSGSVIRVDSRQELDWPMDAGPVRVAPFAAARGTVWDDSPRDGGIGRIIGTVGVRASMYLSRTYPNVQSTLWDLDGVRHIIKPDLVAWVSESTRDPDDLFPFDETVEGISDADGFMLGVRQRWQTKRGEANNRRIVDFLTIDSELGLFNGADGDDTSNGFTSFSRPENSITRNHASTSVIYRVNDRTALLSEFNYDLNDGDVDILNISLAVERSPRFSYLLGYRLIEDTDSNLLGFDLNYQLAEKHTMAIRERFDLDRGRTLDFTIALIRRFPRWFSALSFALDEAEDDFGVSLSLWPEGLPSATLGSRRFAGLGRTTRISRN